MFNYYNPCSMCVPVPVYLQDSNKMRPIEHDSMNRKYPDNNDEDLKSLYPKIYFKIYPLVKQHCNIMEKEKDRDYCPSKKEVNDACKKIYEKVKPQLDEDQDDYTRQRRYRRHHAIRDLTGILLINELLDRRRYHNYDYDHDYDYDYDHDYDYHHNHDYHYNY